MAGTGTEDMVTSLSRWRERRAGGPSRADGLYTIREVGDACGLPGPVIMQLVPRTWTDYGWKYTRDQLNAAVIIAVDLRRDRLAATTPDVPAATVPAPGDRLVCDRCGAGVAADSQAASAWFTVVEATGRVDDGTVIAQDFCPRCVTPCPACGEQPGDRHCPQCFGTGRIPAP
ncbi:hypothetical protein ACQ86B_28590 (plasmid) [Mycolicibacterium aichiense]|uniref:hypothetical protein n=1 Tax=Mycolicibacterium aichiense TaxID=1799 RepID=UPI003D66DF3F